MASDFRTCLPPPAPPRLYTRHAGLMGPHGASGPLPNPRRPMYVLQARAMPKHLLASMFQALGDQCTCARQVFLFQTLSLVDFPSPRRPMHVPQAVFRVQKLIVNDFPSPRRPWYVGDKSASRWPSLGLWPCLGPGPYSSTGPSLGPGPNLAFEHKPVF